MAHPHFIFPIPKSDADRLPTLGRPGPSLEEALRERRRQADTDEWDDEVVADDLVEVELPLWDCTHSWYEEAVRLFPELSEQERITRLEAFSLNEMDGREMVHYTMMMSCLAQLPDDRLEAVIAGMVGLDGSGPQISTKDVRYWSSLQGSSGGLMRGSWMNSLFYQSRDYISTSMTESRTRGAIDRMVESGFSQSHADGAAWLADHVVRIMPTHVENGLAFLRVLAEHGVAPAPAEALPKDLVHLVTVPATATWSTAIRIQSASTAMSDTISSARQALGVVLDPDAEPSAARRRARLV